MNSQEIQKLLNQRDADISNALAELASRIDAFLLIAPLQFIEGADVDSPLVFDDAFDDAGARHDAGSKFPGWFMRPLTVMFPNTVTHLRRIEGAAAHLETIRDEAGDIDGEYMGLCYDANRLAFVIGYMTGLRVQGATPAEVFSRSRGFVLQEINTMKWFLEREAKAKKDGEL